MAAVELRPLSLGELLDRVFALYRRHFLLFIGIMLFPQLFVTATGIVYAVAVTRLAVTQQPAAPAQAAVLLGVMMISVTLMWVSYLALHTVGQGGSMLVLSDLHRGHTPTVREVYRNLWPKLGRLVGTALLAWMLWGGVIFAGMMLMAFLVAALALTGSPEPWLPVALFLAMLVGAVPAVYIFLRTALSLPAVTVEPVTVTAAIGRSWHLTRGAVGRLFALLLLFGVLTAVGFGLFQLPLLIVGGAALLEGGQGPLWLQVLMQLGAFFSGIFLAPVWAIAFSVLYYDLRVRKEALDLELMMQNLDAGAQPASPA